MRCARPRVGQCEELARRRANGALATLVTRSFAASGGRRPWTECRQSSRPRASVTSPPRLVVRENNRIIAGHAFEQPQLRAHVRRHVAVAIQMVGADVQHAGNAWVERLDPLELKAGNLDDANLGVLEHRQRQRPTEIAAGKRSPPARFHDPPEQGDGRALAVGSGNRKKRSLQRARGQLELRDDALAARLRRRDQRVRARNPGAHDDFLDVVEGARNIRGLDDHALRRQLPCYGVGDSTVVRDERDHPLGGQQARRREPTGTESEHEGPLHFHRLNAA